MEEAHLAAGQQYFQIRAVEAFFLQEFYRPGLLQEIMQERAEAAHEKTGRKLTSASRASQSRASTNSLF